MNLAIKFSTQKKKSLNKDFKALLKDINLFYNSQEGRCNFFLSSLNISLIKKSFFIFFCRRNHLSNWSMSKENHDPTSNENQPSKLRSIQSQKSLEKSSSSQANNSPKMSANINNASDLFELLERCQSQRLDDQRCVLPSYFSQVSKR